MVVNEGESFRLRLGNEGACVGENGFYVGKALAGFSFGHVHSHFAFALILLALTCKCLVEGFWTIKHCQIKLNIG